LMQPCDDPAVALAQAGDEEAFRSLVERHSRANFGTWLHRVAVNCALDFMRVRRRRDTGREGLDAIGSDGARPLPAADPQPDRLLFSAEVQERVAAVAELMPKERVAFVLRHFEEILKRSAGRWACARMRPRTTFSGPSARHSPAMA
jgi:DNA-directed RNA polymerase specialized sigma24 family protein